MFVRVPCRLWRCVSLSSFLVSYVVFVVFFPLCLPVYVCVRSSVFAYVTFCVCLHFLHRRVECLQRLLGGCTRERTCVLAMECICVFNSLVCAYRGSVPGLGQSGGDSRIDGLQRERHGLPPQRVPGSAPPHPVRRESNTPSEPRCSVPAKRPLRVSPTQYTSSTWLVTVPHHGLVV